MIVFWGWVGRNAPTIIALAALFFSVWAGLFVRQNARISALPLLHPFQTCTPRRVEPQNVAPFFEGTMVAQLINGGLGPAIVTRYEVFANGVLMDLEDMPKLLTEVAALFGVNPDNSSVERFSFQGSIVVPKDGNIKCLVLKFTVPTQDVYQRVCEQLGRFRLRVEYQSMYGDQLLFDSAVPSLPPSLGLVFLRKRR